MKKRVLFIDEDPGRTGSTVSLEYLVKGFSERNCDVFVLTSKKDDKTKSRLKENAQIIDLRAGPIKTLTLNLYFTNRQSILSLAGTLSIFKEIIKFFLGIILFAKTIKLIKPDLVYLNEYSVIQASISSYFMKIPSVIHIRSRMISGLYGIRRFIISNLIFGFNKKIFAITEIEARQLNPNKKQIHKVYVIPEFFPCLRQSSKNLEAIKDSFKLPRGKIIITMVGGILDIKGSKDYLKAALEISNKHSEVMFVLAGKNFADTNKRLEYYNQCVDLINKLKQTSSIIELGEITNSLELIEASDIIISPSNETHFSRPVVEAWGLRKPVVVAETEHAKNLIKNGENGLLFPPTNHFALADCIVQLVESKDLRMRLAANGRKVVIEKFNAEKNIQAIFKQCVTSISRKVTK